MSIHKSRPSKTISEMLEKLTDEGIVNHYFGVEKLPCRMKSPLHEDKHPSFAFFLFNDKIFFKDFSLNVSGSVYKLLSMIWNCSFEETVERIYMDNINSFSLGITHTKKLVHQIKSTTKFDAECKIRMWKDHDIKYWKQYGISLEWLKYAEVYPVQCFFFSNDEETFSIPADKYAYVYVERKGGKPTFKFYQPYNTKGFKWRNNFENSTISLWTKIPAKGDYLCICSSVKDSLCLWANTGIPAIAPQGEGYTLSDTVINDLKKHFKQVFVCYDNDVPGIEDAKKIVSLTGFTNIEIPAFEGGKDVSDYFKVEKKEKFVKTFSYLFNLNKIV